MPIKKKSTPIGRLRRAPENFLTQQFADEVYEHGLNDERRGFLRKSFVVALAATAAGTAVAAEGEKLCLKSNSGKQHLVSQLLLDSTVCHLSGKLHCSVAILQD